MEARLKAQPSSHNRARKQEVGTRGGDEPAMSLCSLV